MDRLIWHLEHDGRIEHDRRIGDEAMMKRGAEIWNDGYRLGRNQVKMGRAIWFMLGMLVGACVIIILTH